MKRTVGRLALFALLATALPLSAMPTIYPLGVTVATEGTWPGGVIFQTVSEELGGEVVILLGANGKVVHTWLSPYDGWKLGYTRPLASGNVLSKLEDEEGNGMIVEMDWDGNVVWELSAPTRFHHDHRRLPTGDTLILISREFIDPNISDQLIDDDGLLIVDKNGKVKWEWQTADHFEEFGFSDDMRERIYEHAGDWAHANAAAVIPPNPSMTDPRFQAGNIVISYRFINSIVIIDRDTGEIVWRTDGLTIGQHDSYILPFGMPGAGNMLVFDNGLGGHYNNGGTEVWRSFSRVVEINPFDLSIPWEYTAKASGLPEWSFNSYFMSSAQRLENGNTFITEGANGRLFEVTPEGKIVWEYVSPYWWEHERQGLVNRIYRAAKVPLGWGSGGN